MHPCQGLATAYIMLRNETWLHKFNDIQSKFIHYASWIYGRSIKGFSTHDNDRCFEELITVFKFANIITLLS